MDYKKLIARCVRVGGLDADALYDDIVYGQSADAGDYALPLFKYAKRLGKSPADLAKAAADSFVADEFIERCAPVGGYVNFYLKRAAAASDVLKTVAARGQNFAPAKRVNKTICIDYSSINIAKPFHIGHLLTTVIGGSLYRIAAFLGYDVIGINHLGDWGTQFGKLVCAYKKWGNDADIERRGIRSLLELYVRFHAEAENDKSLEDEGRRWFKRIEDGDADALKIFSKFKEVTLRDVDKVYNTLGVRFDSYNGESFYNDKLDAVTRSLKAKGLLTESDGAEVVDLSEFGMPPCLIRKSDGASLYATRDLAAAVYRKKTYNFDKCLYVVAYQQNLHFKQVFKVLELMGYPWAGDCEHVPFGMVSLENSGALSTRKGNVVFLEDVLETSVQKTRGIIESKNPALPDKESVAKAVGVGAVIFFALSTSRIKDTVFSYDKALNFDGETAPYIQYTHARCCSILEKCVGGNDAGADFNGLCDDAGFGVVKLLARFDETVAAAWEKYEPSILARYLIDLCQVFNKFYIDHKVAGNPERVLLTRCVRDVIKNGLSLLLIEAPNKM
ncbi:MAG: arginine--tRNA ligase [Clostridiales bacterium]|jgi:arginyl-tRNA synthetase|nr:arginine--tRNA ligase [Clostridiales bacterium]